MPNLGQLTPTAARAVTCRSAAGNPCHKPREGDSTPSDSSERSQGEIGTAERGINKNASHGETERKISDSQRTQIAGQTQSFSQESPKILKEWSFIFEAYSAAERTQLAQGLKGAKNGGVAPFLAQLNETEMVLTVNLHYIPNMMSSGRA